MWITAKDNRYFASSFANRIWGYLTGVGIIEPLDDIRAGNPPSNPELLDYLTKEFIASGFNTRHLMKLVAKSRTYQLSVVGNRWNYDDKINFSHATARRLPAEVLYDSIIKVTGAKSNIPGATGLRAAGVDVIDIGRVDLVAIAHSLQHLRRQLDRGDVVQRSIGLAPAAGRSNGVVNIGFHVHSLSVGVLSARRQNG